MIKKLLLALGLRRAPAPVRSYLAASSFVGGLPAIAFVAWKYRSNIKQLVARARSRGGSAPQPA